MPTRRPDRITQRQSLQALDVFAPDDRFAAADIAGPRDIAPATVRTVRQQPERALLAQIRTYLRAVHVAHWRIPVTGRPLAGGGWASSPAKGVSDLIAILSGQFWGIEAKAPGGRLRPDQIAFGAAVQHAGGLFTVAYSVDDVRAVVEGHPGAVNTAMGGRTDA